MKKPNTNNLNTRKNIPTDSQEEMCKTNCYRSSYSKWYSTQ